MALGKGWGIPALVAATLLLGCDSVEVDPHIDPNAYHSQAMGIRFHSNDTHVIREKTDGDIASVSIVPGSGSHPWLMGGAALQSASTTSSDAEDIDALMGRAAVEFKPNPVRGQRTIPEVGTYAKLSGIRMVADGNGSDPVAMVQEIYYISANGRVYSFLFMAPADNAEPGRAEFEVFFNSIRFE